MNAKTVAAVLVSMALVGFAACGETLTSPTPQTPSSPSGPYVRSLAISGNTSIAPGETTRLTATATFSDGTQRDVTAQTRLSCYEGSGLVTIVSPGVIEAKASGWTVVAAQYDGPGYVRAEVQLRLAPEGVFLLDFDVNDGQWPIMDALVRVTSPAGTFSATTGLFGEATLPAVGDTVVQVEMDGYSTMKRSMTVTRDQAVQHVLQPSGMAGRD